MIICIGREFGSGGHEIGRKVAEKLGLELYDRDLSVIRGCMRYGMMCRTRN